MIISKLNFWQEIPFTRKSYSGNRCRISLNGRFIPPLVIVIGTISLHARPIVFVTGRFPQKSLAMLSLLKLFDICAFLFPCHTNMAAALLPEALEIGLHGGWLRGGGEEVPTVVRFSYNLETFRCFSTFSIRIRLCADAGHQAASLPGQWTEQARGISHVTN
jgi:hypothetical protein